MALRLQAPRGELKFWSSVWIICGAFASIFYVYRGQSFSLFLTIPVGLCAVGLWLRIKLCGYLLFGLLVLTCMAAVPLIFRGGGFDFYRAFRVCLSVYFAYLVFSWLREYDDQGEENEDA